MGQAFHRRFFLVALLVGFGALLCFKLCLKPLMAQEANPSTGISLELPQDLLVPKPKDKKPSRSDKKIDQSLNKIQTNLQGHLPPQDPLLKLSFNQAILLGLRNNLESLLAREEEKEAKGEFQRALSVLLPNLQGSVVQTRQTINLIGEGFDPSIFGISGGVFGPYNRFDARASVVQTIFDLSALGIYQAGRSNIRLAKFKVSLAQDEVFQSVGLAYVNAEKTKAVVIAAQADLELSATLLNLTATAFHSGLATGIDFTRAKTNFAQNKTRLSRAQTVATQAKLRLKQSLIIPMEVSLQLTTPLTQRAPFSPPSVDVALKSADQNRPDLKVVREEVKLRNYEKRVAVGKQVPSLAFAADYGASGITIGEGLGDTYQFGGQLNIPIFDGGNTLGEISVAKSKRRQALLVLNNLYQQVDEEVRSALVSLQAASSEIESTKEALDLSQQQVELARLRFFTGVGDNLELVQAQTSLSNARDSYAQALSDYHSARINLATATGQVAGFEF